MSKPIIIENKSINEKPYLVAEIGLNHNKDLNTAFAMIKAAKESGADAVKFQAYNTSKLLVKNSAAFDIFKSLQLTKEEFRKIRDYCRSESITFFATPFCIETVDMLEELEVPCFKVASMDINYYELLEHIGMKRKPVILSTGMASIGEIERAVNTICKVGNDKIVILHCISKYPSAPEEMNLNMITKLKSVFPEFTIGLSDHCMDNTMSVAARVLGATVFERHFTIDRNMEGPDQKISLDAETFKDLKYKLEQVDFGLIGTEERADIHVAKGARRSLFAACDIKKGTVITKEMILVVRPGEGIAPEFLPLFTGRKATRDILSGEQFSMSDI